MNIPLKKMELAFLAVWLALMAAAFLTARWIGAWSVLLALGTAFAFDFIILGRFRKRHWVWTMLTTRCPQCGMWPMLHRGSDDKHGFLVCEKCQIEWDLGRGMGAAGGNYDPTSLVENISQIIDKQIQNNDPPETRQTMDRLAKEGHTVDEARKLISMAAMVEVFHIYCDRKPFDPKRYVWNLSRLPQEPWDVHRKEIYKPIE